MILLLHKNYTCIIIPTFLTLSDWPANAGHCALVDIVWSEPSVFCKPESLVFFFCSISLPNDNTYQSVYKFGIYTRLTSKVLPLSVTWYSLPDGVTSLWVSTEKKQQDFFSVFIRPWFNSFVIPHNRRLELIIIMSQS